MKWIEIFKPGQKVNYTHFGKENVLRDVLFNNILINLLSNTAEFSAENKPIFINTKVANKKIIFTMRDEGIDISKKDQGHVCEIFFRAANAINIPGTGPGLHIVAK